MSEIKLVQIPIIQHDLVNIGRSVTQRLEDLNIDGQVATEDTVKALKTLRAELNKELAEYETQRKAVKEAVNNPYNEFEATYKEEVSDKYKSAVEKLKDKIAFVEDKIKSDKRENVLVYFSELCMNEDIDFLTFNQLGLDINLSTSEKAYRDKCLEFVTRVADDLALIDTQEHKAEILVEYKNTLNASKSIKEIQDRKQAEKLKLERIYFAEQNRRKSILLAHAMTFNGMTGFHEFEEDVFISDENVKNLSKEEFATKIIQIEESIKAKKLKITQESTATEVVQAVMQTTTLDPNPEYKKPEPLKAPTVEVIEETFLAKFECTITRKQGAALKEFFINNNINYKNI